MFNILKLLGNIEPNPRLKTNKFSIFHRNLNSLSAHSFSRLTQ